MNEIFIVIKTDIWETRTSEEILLVSDSIENAILNIPPFDSENEKIVIYKYKINEAGNKEKVFCSTDEASKNYELFNKLFNTK